MANTNEWTVMFYFGGDNSLSPLFVSQLKAIKDAGFQKNTKVLVHFDPNAKGVPTRLFDVNEKRKIQARSQGASETHVGDGKDPFVRDMLGDYIHPKDINPSVGPVSKKIKEAMEKTPDTVEATQALDNFLGYCRENHPAKHYILFLVGHGMIVANDKFLSDDNPVSGISLKSLGDTLRNFSEEVGTNGALELVALHSCSMSSIEVAYELQGTANYMMASQGMSFIGSWPYRQLLKKAFNVIEGTAALSPTAVQDLMEKLYYLSLYNATDFVMSGYSQDLCLTQLATEKFDTLKESLPKLVKALKDGLQDQRVMELIQLAHLKSQSFWQEDYTDLSDFCQCLSDSVEDTGLQGDIKTACDSMIQVLKADSSKPSPQLIVKSDNFGWEYQYSRGLSVYFPWSAPIGDVGVSFEEAYKIYKFTTEFSEDPWLSFLVTYFEKTKREPQKDSGRDVFDNDNKSILDSFSVDGSLNKPTGGFNKPTGGSGIDCGCPSIKNYPTTELTEDGTTRRGTTFTFTEGLSGLSL